MSLIQQTRTSTRAGGETKTGENNTYEHHTD